MAWRGMCEAPGHESQLPETVELEACNLGYAKGCPRLPKERAWDAIRFGIAHESGASVSVQYVMEMAYQPAGHGMLEYDRVLARWTLSHPEARVQKMAECFLQSYLDRRKV